MSRPMQPCDTCSGFGTVTIDHDTGVIGTGYYTEELCPDCEGAAEVEALCPGCDQTFDANGYCRRCEEWFDCTALTEVEHLGPGRVMA